MEYRLLGRSGLKVSTLTMGTMTFGGGGQIGATPISTEAQRQIDLCLDAGVNLIDTANVYSTRRLRDDHRRGAGRRPPRAACCVATKVRFTMGEGPNDRGLSRYHIIARGAKPACKRLKTDVIDLYQVHEWDGQTPLEETHGGARHAGPPGQGPLRRLLQLFGLAHHEGARRRRRAPLPALRPPADPLHAAGPRGRVRAGADQPRPGRVGMLVWTPLAGGLLSGKYTARLERPTDGRQVARLHASRRSTTGSSSGTSSTCGNEVAEAHGVSGAQVALAWLLQRPGRHLGDHRRPQRGAVRGQPQGRRPASSATEEIAQLDKVSQPPLIYPYWHQNRSVYDRLGAADLAFHAGYPRP